MNMVKHLPADYSTITESPGLQASKEQISRLYQRYHFATRYANNAEVLEVACGTGIGLGYLAQYARKVTGIDIDKRNLEIARAHYNNTNSILLQKMDAHNLEIGDNAFDLTLFYEAIYYMHDAQKCISEIYRTLKINGILIVCTVNNAWKDFHPSPYAAQYYSVPELYSLLGMFFPDVTVYGAFPVKIGGLKAKTVSYLKRAAIHFDLIPGSLKLRSYLKRIFFGKLAALPAEVYNNMTYFEEPVNIPSQMPCEGFTTIYMVARK